MSSSLRWMSISFQNLKATGIQQNYGNIKRCGLEGEIQSEYPSMLIARGSEDICWLSFTVFLSMMTILSLPLNGPAQMMSSRTRWWFDACQNTYLSWWVEGDRWSSEALTSCPQRRPSSQLSPLPSLTGRSILALPQSSESVNTHQQYVDLSQNGSKADFIWLKIMTYQNIVIFSYIPLSS